MDAFDTIREIARRQHESVGEVLSAKFKAIDLVRAIAKNLDLELYPLDPDDPLLAGTFAVLERNDGAIYHVNNVSEQDLAVLIAHELGHQCIHTNESLTNCTQSDVDGTATSEASPVGADRVAGYGAKERRELQANVFARELLLPQPFVRDFYLNSAVTPIQIANNFGLSLALVRQQLIDALLIPVNAESETEQAGIDSPLDPSQEEAATFSGAPLLLEAGPGTGKTRTLISRIVYLINQGTDPAAIMALTYSNKAALELSERVAEVIPEAAAKIWTGTFHAFGLEFIRKYYDHPYLAFPADVSVIDKSDAVAFLEEVLPLLPLNHYKNLWDPLVNLKDILSAISRAKDELISPAEYKRLGQHMLDTAQDDLARETAEKVLEVAAVYERYEELLAQNKLLDFGDLIMKPTLLLETDSVIRNTLQMKYRHVLVDEYQDVNRASARLLKALAGSGERLWVVGDARQSIYRFRGASSANMARFATDFPGSEQLSLGKNYRSTQEIVDAYCGFAKSMTASSGMLPLKLKADKGGSGVLPDLRLINDDESEIGAVAARITELRQQGVPLRKQSILFRSNSTLSKFAAALEKRGIAVLHLGSLFEREEIRELISLLSFIANPTGSALVRLATLEPYNVPLADVTRLLSRARETRTPALEILKTVKQIDGISAQAQIGFGVLADHMTGFTPSSSPWDVLCIYLFERTGFIKSLAQSADVRDQMKCVAIWQFLNFIHTPHAYGIGPPIARLLERIRHLVVLGDERDLRQIPSAARHADAVRMLTIHGSKGLEFEVVHLPSMSRGRVPLQYRGVRCPPPDGMVDEAGDMSGKDYHKAIHAAEEECLYFVAMSRARTRLHHYGKASSPSSFIEKITPPLAIIKDVTLLPMLNGSGDNWSVSVAAGTGMVSANELSRYDSCPRRYLYTYLLCLAGRQRETPFVKAHDCVYEIIQAAKQREVPINKEWIHEQFVKAWKERGPCDHAYEAEYRQIAAQTVENFTTACVGLDIQNVDEFVIDLFHCKVVLNPDQVAKRADGTMLLRRIRTGKLSDKEEDEWIYTLYHAAASDRYGEGGYEVEAVHLTGNTLTPIAPSARKRSNRMEKAGSAAAGIHAGKFPPEPDTFSCPRCPHFFYCPSLPDGIVQLP